MVIYKSGTENQKNDSESIDKNAILAMGNNILLFLL